MRSQGFNTIYEPVTGAGTGKTPAHAKSLAERIVKTSHACTAAVLRAVDPVTLHRVELPTLYFSKSTEVTFSITSQEF